MNITVASQLGELASMRLQVFARNGTTCTNTIPTKFLFNEEVYNSTLLAKLEETNTYCFILNNETYRTDKIASVSASVYTSSEVVTVTKDGLANMAGLGVGAFGFIVVFLGASRKTVIPWD